MHRKLTIFIVLVLSIFSLNLDSVSVHGSACCDRAAAAFVLSDAVPDAGSLKQADGSQGDYNGWSVPELSSAQEQFTPVRVYSPGTRVRTSGGRQGFDSSSFLKAGKVSSIRRAITFTTHTGLFPSGYGSFSHHLISLRKIRL